MSAITKAQIYCYAFKLTGTLWQLKKNLLEKQNAYGPLFYPSSCLLCLLSRHQAITFIINIWLTTGGNHFCKNNSKKLY
jgi:hypothetical protein